MDQQAIVDIIAGHAREVLPDLAAKPLGAADSLRELGANSIDRAEILMLTTATLALRVPLVALSQPRNIGELAELLARLLAERSERVA
ncbi:acyl carrier protein [Duganella sp. Leaf126]|uniref:acyl carrier protein n=1 Tax=Duganella sp. Leaf126 TaxID=1736266 RepID=UPI0006FFEB27|nr:acyl carrier protein [Duganella sp. Leaf126]KQQ40266.1 acyl carrier protein [Duganella sp. Leaf126]